KGSVVREARGPEAAYLVFKDKNGKEKEPISIPVTVEPFTKAEQYKRPGKDLPYADGAYLYEQNAFFSEKIKPELTDIFPTVKQKDKKPGKAIFSTNIKLKWDKAFENEANLLKNT